jgi:hypothetical protein
MSLADRRLGAAGQDSDLGIGAVVGASEAKVCGRVALGVRPLDRRRERFAEPVGGVGVAAEHLPVPGQAGREPDRVAGGAAVAQGGEHVVVFGVRMWSASSWARPRRSASQWAANSVPHPRSFACVIITSLVA